jgi:hypothetical protein
MEGAEGKKFMPMLFEGKKMSELPWGRMAEGIINRWYITMNQMAIPLAFSLKLPDKDMMVKMFGEKMSTAPRINEILENVKRFSLGHRDTDKVKGYERAMPLMLALLTAWSENATRVSIDPGNYNEGAMNAQIANIRVSLESLAPSGDKQVGDRIHQRYYLYMEAFKKMGNKLNQVIARRRLGWK